MASSSQGGGVLNWLLDRIAPLSPAPESPVSPAVDQDAWNQSVEAHKINALTVHDVGLIVFGETQSVMDHDNANKTVDSAREKAAHVAINGDTQYGLKRPVMAPPIKPTAEALKNPQVSQAYESSMKAARESFLSPTDPTNGAPHMNMRPIPDRSNFKAGNPNSEGYAIKT